MSRSSDYVPKHCHHKHSDLGVVRLDGRALYTAKWGTPEAQAKYDRLISEWLARGRSSPHVPKSDERFRVSDLCAEFLRWAKDRYSGGKEYENIRYALRPVHRLYGDATATDFGPRAFKAVRVHMVQLDWSRKLINSRCNLVKRAFKWAVGEELIPAESLRKLQAIPGLRRGELPARETKPVEPVSQGDIDAVIPHVSRQVAAMIRLQLLTGMRPGEVVLMRLMDLDRTQEPWVYHPAQHKLLYHELKRSIYLGRRARGVVWPFLRRSEEEYLFRPEEAVGEHRAKKGAARKSKVQPSQVRRKEVARGQQRQEFGEHYTVASYRRAIARGCEQADVQKWAPNRLRHTAATEIARRLGLEAARTVLGHTSTTTTEIYAQPDREAARKVMESWG